MSINSGQTVQACAAKMLEFTFTIILNIYVYIQKIDQLAGARELFASRLATQIRVCAPT